MSDFKMVVAEAKKRGYTYADLKAAKGGLAFKNPEMRPIIAFLEEVPSDSHMCNWLHLYRANQSDVNAEFANS